MPHNSTKLSKLLSIFSHSWALIDPLLKKKIYIYIQNCCLTKQVWNNKKWHNIIHSCEGRMEVSFSGITISLWYFQAMKSSGLLNPPFLFMYCLYFLFMVTLTAYALTDPSVFLPLLESKEPNPINFIISISSSVLPCMSSAEIWMGFVDLASLRSSSRRSEGEEERWRLGGDLERLLWGDRERLLRRSLSRSRERERSLSLRLRSRSREVDRERLLSRLGGLRLLLLPISLSDQILLS